MSRNVIGRFEHDERLARFNLISLVGEPFNDTPGVGGEHRRQPVFVERNPSRCVSIDRYPALLLTAATVICGSCFASTVMTSPLFFS